MIQTRTCRNSSHGKAIELMLSILLATGSLMAHAAPIDGLLNTGVDATGNALPAGSVDPHYSILDTGSGAIVVQDAIPGTWIPNAPNFRWVWEDVTGHPTNVIRTFRTTFDLTGLIPGTALINGTQSTDNTGLDILINGPRRVTPAAGSARSAISR